MKFILLLIFPFLIQGCVDNAKSEKRQKYREESYILNDGTPCTMIKDRRYGWGITCNYKKKMTNENR